MGNIFFEITVILCLAATLAIFLRFLKQPPILAYLLTGIVFGPLAILTLQNQEAIRGMAEIGVTLLLFILGLELKLSDLKSVGKISIIAGILQILLTGVLGYFISVFFGFSQIISLYISTALTFSSTIIVVKLLSDKRDLSSLYGKITIGILLVQDFFAIIALIFLSGLTAGGDFTLESVAILILKAVAVFGWIYIIGKNILPFLVEKIARSQELLFLFALAWVFGLSALLSSPYVGFSIEIGGFLAGLALANTSENYQIVARVKSLRDFFIIIFFVFLGTEMIFLTTLVDVVPIVVFLAFVLIVKPFIILFLLAILGHRKRVSFLSSISFAQVSEFSLVIVFTGERLHQIPAGVSSIIIIVAGVSFVVSTYFMIYSDGIYKKLSRYIDFFERDKINKAIKDEKLKNHIILVGANRMGESVLKALLDNGEKFVVVDFDPDIIKKLSEKNITSFFGDIIDSEIQDLAGLSDAKLIISTVPDIDDNLLLLESIGKLSKKPKVLVAAFEKPDAKLLYENGADYVVLPHLAGGHHLAKMVLDENLSDIIEKYKAREVRELI